MLKEIAIDLDTIHSRAILNCPNLKCIYNMGLEKGWNMIYRQGTAFKGAEIEYIFLG